MNLFKNCIRCIRSAAEKQIAEIQCSKGLQLYGIFVALSHFFTSLMWFQRPIFYEQPICWTFIPFCKDLAPLYSRYGTSMLYIYSILAFLCVLSFLSSKVQLGYFSLIVVLILRIVIQFHDYRLMGNYHYITNIVSIIFLFFSNKNNLLKIAIVGFYISAGLIKFNVDWLSGQALMKEPWITGKASEFLLLYVIILEIFISQLLLSPNRLLYFFALLQIAIFHIYSYSVVGWYYPCIMFCVISLFFIDSEPFGLKSIFFKKSNLLYLFGYVTAQLYPFFIFENSVLSGQGRLLSLNMLDGRAKCVNYLDYEQGHTLKIDRLKFNLGPRISCDPLMYINSFKYFCEKNEIDESEVNFYMYVRNRTSNANFFKLKLKNICIDKPKISFLGIVSQNGQSL